MGAVIGLAVGAFVGMCVPNVPRPDALPRPVLLVHAEPAIPPIDLPDYVRDRIAFLHDEGRRADADRLIRERLHDRPDVVRLVELPTVQVGGGCCKTIDLSCFSRKPAPAAR